MKETNLLNGYKYYYNYKVGLYYVSHPRKIFRNTSKKILTMKNIAIIVYQNLIMVTAKK